MTTGFPFAPSHLVPHIVAAQPASDMRKALTAWLMSFLREHKGDCRWEFTWGELIDYLTHGNPNLPPDQVTLVRGFNRAASRELGNMVAQGDLKRREDGRKEFLSVSTRLLALQAK